MSDQVFGQFIVLLIFGWIWVSLICWALDEIASTINELTKAVRKIRFPEPASPTDLTDLTNAIKDIDPGRWS